MKMFMVAVSSKSYWVELLSIKIIINVKVQKH